MTVTDTQARRLYDALIELTRHFQMRDRDQACCHDVTAAQCYALHALGEDQRTMGELAETLGLAVSTVTRTLDPLVAKGLVQRHESPADRRVCCVSLTDSGRERLTAIERTTLDTQHAVLAELAPKDRETVISAIDRLADALKRCCGPTSTRSC